MNYKEQQRAKQAERRALAKERAADDYRLDEGYQALYQKERGE